MHTLRLLTLLTCFVAPAIGQTRISVPSTEELARLGLERMWVGQARVNPSRDHTTHVTVDERNVYVQASNGSVTAFDAESGRRRWVVQLGPPNRTTFAAVSNADLVLVVTGATVYGVEKSSGHVAWTTRMPQSASTSAAMDDEFFYVGTSDGSVYAFNFDVVRYEHRTGRLPGSFDPSTKAISRPVGSIAATQNWMWRYRTGRSMRQPPARAENLVLIGDTRGQVYGIVAGSPEQQGGKLVFQFQAGNGVAAPLVARGNNAYVPTTDNEIVAVETSGGQLLWQYAAGHRIQGSPLLLDNRLYLTAENEGVIALDTETGDPVETPGGPWWIPGATEMIGATKDTVFASDQFWNLLAVDRETSRAKGKIALPGLTLRIRNDLNDRLYLASNEGLVLCLRAIGAEEATFYRNQDRTPITPLVQEDAAEDAAANDSGDGSGP